MPSRAGFSSFVALTTFGVCFGGMEAWLRWNFPGSIDALNSAAFTRPSTRPGQTTELIPGATNPDFSGGPVRINTAGFRGPELSGETILAVGDSITFGYGVGETEVFHSVVEAGRVVNAGLPSSGLPYYYHAIRRHCAVLDPDLLLVTLSLNDLTPNDPVVLTEVPLPTRGDPTRWDAGLGGSYAYTYGFRVFKGLLYQTRVLNLEDNPGYRFPILSADPALADRAWRESTVILDAIVDAAAQCGAPLVLTVFPLELQLSAEALARYRQGIGIDLAEDATNRRPQKLLAEWAAARAVRFIDVTPAFRLDEPGDLFLRDLYVTWDPVHPSPLGHARAAVMLADAGVIRRR